MTYLLDSDRVADYLKGRPDAVQLLALLLPAGLAISTITYGEVYEGIHYGHDPSRHGRAFRLFLKGVRLIPVGVRVARRFAVLRGRLRQQGQLIPQPDLLIAATALQHNLVLVTRNLRHFQRVPGLQIHPPPA